jgi:hypothetical protein
MSPEFAARLALLEKRTNELEITLRSVRYELECSKSEARSSDASFRELVKDYGILVDDYLASKKKLVGILNDHHAEIKSLAVLAGNSANAIFPKLDEAFQEIDRVLGLEQKKPG